MPFAFLIVGLILIVSGVRGTSQQLLTLVKGDLEGTNSYLYWIVAILIVGSVGYIPSFKNVSRAFLALLLVVLVLREGNSNNNGGGFFQEFTSALKTISTPNTKANTSTSTSNSSVSSLSSLF